MINLKITTRRLKQGHYLITREDGRMFFVLRGTREWIIEARDTGALTGAATLQGAKYDIRQGWTKGVTRKLNEDYPV